MKICIDPGHGGTDSGAVNGKYHEENATLGIALKLGDILKRKGHGVVYTRLSDRTVSLQERCDFAHRTRSQLFVSIHCNSAENKAASGIETFHYPNVGGVTKRLAQNIQNALTEGFPEETDRGVKEEPFYVLKHTNMPAVLVEVGFISHDETARKLFSYSYQNKVANLIKAGIEKTYS